MANCYVCGRKFKFLETKYSTKDQQKLCGDCMHRLFGRNNGLLKTNNIIDWISHHTAMTAKHYIDAGKTLTMKSDGKVEGDTDLFCPYCNSENVQPLGQHHQAFSVGKAAVGAAITGGVGLAAGRRSLNSLANQLGSHRLIDSYEHNQLKASIDYRNSIAHATPITQIRNIIQHIFEGIHLIVQKIIDSRND